MKNLLTSIFAALIFLGCAESEKELESFTVTGERFVFSAQDAYEKNLEEENLKFLALKIYKDSELIFPGLTEEEIRIFIEEPESEVITQSLVDLSILLNKHKTDEEKKEFLEAVGRSYSEYNQLVLEYYVAQQV
ncbi:MAG: hypothetical protein AB3N10_12565, partial [Allomuricauda sp.]